MKDQLDALIDQMIASELHYEDAISEFERRFIKKTLEKNDGNQSRAARALGIHRNTLSRKMNGFLASHRPSPKKRPSR
ncbi:MAG TPA: helix-turn-helix domain-containing protein [Terriglobia bacterium]|nr:helix-turn-helix domain-containing protein [Terriglobia bacterium]